MKITILVALFVALSAAAPTCYLSQCADNGSSCKPTDTTHFSCRTGSFCNSDTTCQASIAAGGDCTKNLLGCADGLTCLNQATCGIANRTSGQTCSTATPCKAYNGIDGTQMDGSCTSGRCSGIAAGANCVASLGLKFGSSNPCVNGYYCSNGGNMTAQATCVANPGTGATCASSTDCADDRASTRLFCAMSPKTCQAYFSQGSGQMCTLVDQCTVGLVCGSDGTCQAQAASSSNKACSAQADCANNEYCACNGNSATATQTCQRMLATTSSHATAWKNAIMCASSDYNCESFYSGSPSTATSCTGSCYKSVCQNFFSKLTNPLELAKDSCLGTAEKKNFDKCKKSAASIFFVAPAVVLVALLALF